MVLSKTTTPRDWSGQHVNTKVRNPNAAGNNFHLNFPRTTISYPRLAMHYKSMASSAIFHFLVYMDCVLGITKAYYCVKPFDWIAARSTDTIKNIKFVLQAFIGRHLFKLKTIWNTKNSSRQFIMHSYEWFMFLRAYLWFAVLARSSVAGPKNKENTLKNWLAHCKYTKRSESCVTMRILWLD